MNKPVKILVIGACGQLGTELSAALRIVHGHEQVLAADVKPLEDTQFSLTPYVQMNVLDKVALHALCLKEKITVIYHLAATLSATGEKQPIKAWELNMTGLLNVLDIAKTDQLKVFWPSSIAVFGNGVMEPCTVYGISKLAGELWCQYYHKQYGVDVRSLRYPGLISYTTPPGGGTTDYAVDIFHQAIRHRQYTSFIKSATALSMMYMADAIRATIELMNAPAEKLSIMTSYNIQAMSFTPEQLTAEIVKHLPAFKIYYKPDFRQQIAESWPASVNDKQARDDWGWAPQYDLAAMVKDMLEQLLRKELQ